MYLEASAPKTFLYFVFVHIWPLHFFFKKSKVFWPQFFAVDPILFKNNPVFRLHFMSTIVDMNCLYFTLIHVFTKIMPNFGMKMTCNQNL